MNKLKIAHRDIKPDNIILVNNCTDFKLADFGLSHDFSIEPKDNSIGGKTKYMAPELLIYLRKIKYQKF